MMNEEMSFTVLDENGRETKCEALFTFDSEETGKSYIVYTDNSVDENGNTQVLAPGAHSQFGSGKNTQFEPEQRANPFENVFSKTAVFPPPAIAETDL